MHLWFEQRKKLLLLAFTFSVVNCYMYFDLLYIIIHHLFLTPGIFVKTRLPLRDVLGNMHSGRRYLSICFKNPFQSNNGFIILMDILKGNIICISKAYYFHFNSNFGCVFVIRIKLFYLGNTFIVISNALNKDNIIIHKL